MANFFNPTNSRVLNVLPVNAGRVIAHTSSITGDTEVVTFASYRLSFTAVVNIQSISSLSGVIPKTKITAFPEEIGSSTNIPFTRAVRGICRDTEIENSTKIISDKILLCRDGYLKIDLCKDNPFDTPVDLSSTCNGLFHYSVVPLHLSSTCDSALYTSTSNTNGLKYYGTSVFQ